MSEYIARLLDAGDSFQWPEDGGGHRSFAALTAVLYLMACSLHNYRLRQRKHVAASKATPILDAASIAHNILLVAFSALVFAVAGYHFALLIASSGLRDFLCQPPLPAALPPTGFGLLNSLLGVGGGDVGGSSSSGSNLPPPLSGRLHSWCYLFYVSKYYELADTVLLMLRGKRIIFLHAMHHALIPLVMALLFDGRVAVSLIGLTTLNSLVHIVMYAYFLASALGATPPLSWKRQITRLQILQFSTGVVGGTWYWVSYFRDFRLVDKPPSALPLLSWLPSVEYSEGCAGGEPMIVLVGYVMNTMLLALFVRFYRDSYLRGKPGGSGSAKAKLG